MTGKSNNGAKFVLLSIQSLMIVIITHDTISLGKQTRLSLPRNTLAGESNNILAESSKNINTVFVGEKLNYCQGP